MNKTDCIASLSAFVLFAGLVSCAKDDKKPVTPDNFRAPPPIINTKKGSDDLKTFDRRVDKSLDLQDSLDVTAGAIARLEVVTHCLRGQESFYENYSLNPRGPVKIFQVVPLDLLTADLAVEKFTCGFELTLSNELGSKHIYNVPLVPLTDLIVPGVTLERTGSTEKISRLHSQHLEGVRARFRNTGAASIEVLCADMTLPSLAFDAVAELNSFDFARPVLKPRRSAQVLAEKPVQTCRLLVRQEGQIIQLSERVFVQMPQAPLKMAVTPLQPPPDQRMALAVGNPLEVGSFTISNPDASGSRFVRINKSGSPSLLQFVFPELNAGGRTLRPVMMSNYARNWMFVLPRSGPEIPVYDNGDHYLVHVPAGRPATFILQLRPPGRMFCADRPIPSANFIVSGAVALSEVNDRGESMGSLNVEFPRTVYSHDIRPDFFPRVVSPDLCQW